MKLEDVHMNVLSHGGQIIHGPESLKNLDITDYQVSLYRYFILSIIKGYGISWNISLDNL